MAASNPQYPVNTTNKAAELMVEENLIANGYLKDFLYAYNYIDRWYDFQIGGINIRDVVLFDNSILKSGKSPRNLVAEIVQLSSSGDVREIVRRPSTSIGSHSIREFQTSLLS